MLNSAESPIEVAPVDFIEMGRDTNSRVDQAAVERSWRERGFSCGLWVDPPGQVDPLVCPQCGEKMRVVAFITQPKVIRRILEHLKELPPGTRAPPQPSLAAHQ